MSDQCPLDLVATHPALELHISKRRSSSLRSFEGKGGEEESEDDEGGGHGHGNGTKASGPAAALRSATDAAARNVSSGPLWARILLFLASFTGIFLGATIAIYPAMSYRIFSIWDLATVECRDVIDYITVAAVPPSRRHPHLPPAPSSPPHRPRAYYCSRRRRGRDGGSSSSSSGSSGSRRMSSRSAWNGGTPRTATWQPAPHATTSGGAQGREGA